MKGVGEAMTRAIHVMLIGFGMASVAVESATGQTITGTLSDRTTGGPIEAASVRLLNGRGQVIATASTNSSGAWTFGEVSRGSDYTIRAQKAGYAIVEVPAFELGSAPLVFDLETTPQVTRLEEVSASSLNFAGFANRRDRRIGHSIGPEDVDRRLARIKPRTTSRFLLGLQPGIHTGPDRSEIFIAGCKPTYMIDRKLYFPPWGPQPPIDIDSLVEPWEIRAVELYTDPTFIPSGFRIVFPPYRCEVLIVVWTFRGVGWEPTQNGDTER
jgi:Carboxypeptidase regulatory-like domain